MIDIKLRYHLTVAIQGDDILPTQENFSKLFQAFKDQEIIPTSFQELLPNNTIRKGIRLASINSEWEIIFRKDKIDFQKRGTTIKGGNIGSFESYCEDLKGHIDKIFTIFNKKASRIGIVSSAFLNEMTSAQFDSIYKKLNNNPFEFYQKHQPTEWINRYKSSTDIELLSAAEPINCISTIARSLGNYFENSTRTTSLLDRVLFELEINTDALNLEYRFDLERLKLFCDESAKLHSSLENDIISKLTV